MKIRRKMKNPKYIDELEDYIDELDRKDKSMIKNETKFLDEDRLDKKKNQISASNDGIDKEISENFSEFRLYVGLSMLYFIVKNFNLSFAQDTSNEAKVMELIEDFLSYIYFEYVDGLLKFCVSAIWVLFLFDEFRALFKKDTSKQLKLHLVVYIFIIAIILYFMWADTSWIKNFL